MPKLHLPVIVSVSVALMCYSSVIFILSLVHRLLSYMYSRDRCSLHTASAITTTVLVRVPVELSSHQLLLLHTVRRLRRTVPVP